MKTGLCVCYLHVADSSLLEGAVLQVVGADVTIFTPMTRKLTADTGSAPERGREREKFWVVEHNQQEFMSSLPKRHTG